MDGEFSSMRPRIVEETPNCWIETKGKQDFIEDYKPVPKLNEEIHPLDFCSVNYEDPEFQAFKSEVKLELIKDDRPEPMFNEESHPLDFCSVNYEEPEFHSSKIEGKQDLIEDKPVPKLNEESHPLDFCSVNYEDPEFQASKSEEMIEDYTPVPKLNEDSHPLDFCSVNYEDPEFQASKSETQIGNVEVKKELVESEWNGSHFKSREPTLEGGQKSISEVDHKHENLSQCPEKLSDDLSIKSNYQLPFQHSEGVAKKRPRNSKSFVCTECGQILSRKEHLHKHILRVHQKIKPFSCSLCERSFSTKHSLNNHIRKVHDNLTEVTQIQIENIDVKKELVESEQEESHFERKEPTLEMVNNLELLLNEKKEPTLEVEPKSTNEIDCKVENMPQSAEELLNLVLGSHLLSSQCSVIDDQSSVDQNSTNKSKSFICPQCGVSLTRKEHLQRHILTVHEKNKQFKCSQCDKAFTAVQSLNSHIKIIHEKIKPHKCPHCKYACGQKGTLNIHIRSVHEKVKEFNCQFCDYMCNSKGSLTSHIKLCHDPRRPLKCTDCSYTFTKNTLLTRHMKSVHEKS